MAVSSLPDVYEARLGDVVRAVRDVLRRRYLVLVTIALIVMLIGVNLTYLIAPRYYGTVLIQIDPSQDPLSKSRNGPQADLASEAIETRVTALQSLDLARAVITRLQLMRDPQARAEVARALAHNSALSADQQIDVVANWLEKHLTIAREKMTYVISIRYSSTSPEMAARVANEFAAAYLDGMVNNTTGTASKQSVFFQNQLNQLASDAQAADAQVAAVEARTGLIAKSDTVGSITDQQIGPLSVTMATTQSVAAQAQARAASARRSVAGGKPDTIADVRESRTVIDLKTQRMVLMQSLADMEQRYGEAYPDLIKVREQIAQIDQQLAIEGKRVIASLDSEAGAAQAQAASLHSAMESLRSRKAAEIEASVTLQSLQRDADSKHAAYDRMAAATMDTRQASQSSFAQAQIIDAARVPDAPYFPRWSAMIALSLIAGTVLGLVVIAAQEVMVSGLTSVQNIEGDLGQRLIAAIPLVKNTARPADLLVSRPTSQYAEALRNARATILGVKGDNPYKIIAVTSALPNEGKTTTAYAMARTMAINGARTIILDTDVRSARLNRLIAAAPPAAGLVEVLSGAATLDGAIRSTDQARLDVLGVSRPHFTSENLFGSDRFHGVLDELARRYDTIILDLPPLIGLADGRFLAALADAVVLIVKWKATPQAAVRAAISGLQSDHANLIGVVYSMVEPMAHAYGSSAYNSAAYAKYYEGRA
ncbi:GumC family protein [Novosphingobium sp.]|uniref:GumC family protein n=1 Tax=Novosphingobium sp. TaxID=1874826 RepID=UPI003D134A52